MSFQDVQVTVGQAAAILSRADGFHSEAYLARQLRHLFQNGGLQARSYRGEGRTAAAVMDLGELLAASVQGYLLRAGFATEHLSTVRRLMNNITPRIEIEKPPSSMQDLALRIAQIINDNDSPYCDPNKDRETWFLNIHLPRHFQAVDGDEPMFTGSWSTSPEDGFEHTRIVNPATIVLDGNYFVRRIISALQSDAAPAE